MVPNVLKILDMYIENLGFARSIRLDQAKGLVGNQVKTFCSEKKTWNFVAHLTITVLLAW